MRAPFWRHQFPALLLGEGLNLPLQFISGLSFGDSAAPRLLDQAARAFVFPLDTFNRISSTLTGSTSRNDFRLPPACWQQPEACSPFPAVAGLLRLSAG
jgi:hypothetical protein